MTTPTAPTLPSPATIPTVDTARLHLRGFVESDFDAYARWMSDVETTRYLGGKPLEREEAWRSLAMMMGHWVLRGYGMWCVVERASGAVVGRVGLWCPEGWPGLECGWLIAPEHRRKGYAIEAARAAFAWGWPRFPDVQRILSIIHVDNAPSIATALALGERKVGERTIRGFPCALYALDRPATG